MTRNAVLGETIELSELDKVIKSVRINVNWQLLPNLKNPPEGDIFCFLRDKNGIAPHNEDFIFFNQMENEMQTALLGSPVLSEDDDGVLNGNQSIILHLSKLHYDITDILIGFNLYRAGERDQSLRYIEHLSADLAHEQGDALLHYPCPLDDHKGATCITLMKLSRGGNGWAVEAIDKTYTSFNEIAREHGIVVAG